MNFNKQQLETINHKDGACAVISGAGSGKTTVLLNRIENLISSHNVPQRDILTISFTRNTANELKKKLEAKGYDNVKTGTFHALCMDILAKENFNIKNIIAEWDSQKIFVKANYNEDVDVKDILSFIGYQKNNMINWDGDFLKKESKYSSSELRKFYKAYEAAKQQERKYDLDDYLLECYKILLVNKGKYTWDYVLVDEHQDNNLVQNLLINEWCKRDNLMVIGDFRQAIYSFRGARPELFMNFYKEHKNTKVLNLDINYRSCKNIVDKSNNFIKRYYGDYTYYSDSIANNQENGTINTSSFHDRKEESQKIVESIELLIKNGESPKEIAILYRNNSHADYIECELREKNIQYDIVNDSSFFKRKEIAMILNILRLIKNAHDDEAFELLYKSGCYPLTKCCNKTLENVKQIAGKKNLSYYESFIDYKFDKSWEKSSVFPLKDALLNLKSQNEKGIDVQTLINNVIKSFRIHNYIETNYKKQEDIDDRVDSFNTLLKFVKDHNLNTFLRYIYSPIPLKKRDNNVIKLMTIHGSKGLEFNNVFVVGIEDGKFPSDKSNIKEEARLMYVAVTRPKENLYLSSIGESQFIREYGSDKIHK